MSVGSPLHVSNQVEILTHEGMLEVAVKWYTTHVHVYYRHLLRVHTKLK